MGHKQSNIKQIRFDVRQIIKGKNNKARRRQEIHDKTSCL